MVGLHVKPDITLVFPRSPFLINETMFPPLGIMYLSSFLRLHGLNAQLMDMALKGTNPADAESDIIGISITTPQRTEAFTLAQFYRQMGKKAIIAGGPHATHMPDDCLANGFTHVVKGYGEIPLLNMLSIAGSECDNIPIDNIPYPDRDSLPIKAYYQEIRNRPATVIMSSRGCPYHCSFCSKIDNKAQYQSAGRTLAEIFHVREKYGFHAFTMYDDTFAADMNRLKIMTSVLEKEDIFFRCFCRSNLITPDVAAMFARMGVDAVGIGIESGSNAILSKNMKRTTRDVNTKAIEHLRRFGIKSKAFLIVGLPGESQETIEETVSWIEEAKPNDISVSVFQPLPGSDIFREPAKWGISFSMNGAPMWYRGKPGHYIASTRTEKLTTEQIVFYRDMIESMYKPSDLLK